MHKDQKPHWKKPSLVSHSRVCNITQILADLAAAPQNHATATAGWLLTMLNALYEYMCMLT